MIEDLEKITEDLYGTDGVTEVNTKIQNIDLLRQWINETDKQVTTRDIIYWLQMKI